MKSSDLSVRTRPRLPGTALGQICAEVSIFILASACCPSLFLSQLRGFRARLIFTVCIGLTCLCLASLKKMDCRSSSSSSMTAAQALR
jgi:hypothetical protein